jgi:hypothetical protein
MPIDETMQMPKEEKKTYPPLPKNVYQVELLDIALKDAKGLYAKPGEKNLSFQFTLLAGKDKDGDLRGRNVWANFVPTSLFMKKTGKNALWQIAEAFIGRELTPGEEAAGLSGKLVNSFIGSQIKVFVDHREMDGKIYDNITSYMPSESQLPSLTDEERENARVKNKSSQQSSEQDDIAAFNAIPSDPMAGAEMPDDFLKN